MAVLFLLEENRDELVCSSVCPTIGFSIDSHTAPTQDKHDKPDINR